MGRGYNAIMETILSSGIITDAQGTMRSLANLSSSCHKAKTRFANSPIRIGVVDVPFNKGQGKGGVDDGPKCIREGGLLEQLEESCGEVDIKDYGPVTYKAEESVEIHNMKNYADIISCNKALSEKVKKVIDDGRICLTLGGDHSIGVGSISGHLKAKRGDNVAVVWVDAHADINTNRTSSSGNVHGMPVAMLAKEVGQYFESALPGLGWIDPKLTTRNLVYIGLRSVDRYERVILRGLGIHYFDMFDVQRHGIDAVIGAALDKVDPDHSKSLHVSFDIDGLDPSEAPSTGTPVRGGLLLREGMHIMSTIFKTGRMGVMDLVEVNPHVGDECDVQKTVEAAINLITAAFGSHNGGACGAFEKELQWLKEGGKK